MNILNLRNYGDISEISKDSKALQDIINRQGTNFIMDCIAEYTSTIKIKYNLDKVEVMRLKANLFAELNEAINERT